MNQKPEVDDTLKQQIAQSKARIQDMYRAVSHLRAAVESGDFAGVETYSLATERLQALIERDMDDMDSALQTTVEKSQKAMEAAHQSAARLRELHKQMKLERQSSYDFGVRHGQAEAKKAADETIARLREEMATTAAELEQWQAWWNMLDPDLQEEIKTISAEIAAAQTPDPLPAKAV